MCKNAAVPVRVKIHAKLSCTGKEKFKDVEIDACIASIVKALQEGSIDMYSSCCGHGKTDGFIDLQDGRGIVILSPERNTAFKDDGHTRIFSRGHNLEMLK